MDFFVEFRSFTFRLRSLHIRLRRCSIMCQNLECSRSSSDLRRIFKDLHIRVTMIPGNDHRLAIPVILPSLKLFPNPNAAPKCLNRNAGFVRWILCVFIVMTCSSPSCGGPSIDSMAVMVWVNRFPRSNVPRWNVPAGRSASAWLKLIIAGVLPVFAPRIIWTH